MSRTTRQPTTRRAPALVAIAVAVAVAAGAAVWLLAGGSGPKPGDAAARFVAAWTRGDDRGAAGVTDRPRSAAGDLEANRRGLDGAKVRATLGEITEDGDTARAAMRVEWDVPGIGPFAYDRDALRKADDEWRIALVPEGRPPAPRSPPGAWAPPASRPPRRDPRPRRPCARARPRPSYRVGLQRDKVTGRRRDRRRHGRRRRHRRAARSRAPSAAAGPKQFVDGDHAARGRLRARSRTGWRRSRASLASAGTAPLAPSREFGRALLGARRARPRPSSSRSSGRAARPATRSASGARRPLRGAARPAPPSASVVIRDGRRPDRHAARARPAARAGRCARRSTPASSGRRGGAWATGPTRPRWSPSSRRPATSWPWPTGRSTRRTTARSRAATRPARRSRS